MKKTYAVYPGTFDPLTFGHLDIIQRAVGVFDNVMIAVSQSSTKNPFFSQSERIEMIQKVVDGRCKVIGFDGLLVDFMQDHALNVVVRGVRTAADFEFEAQLAGMNKALMPSFETVYFSASPKYMAISASLVREIVKMGGDISTFVPDIVASALLKKCS